MGAKCTANSLNNKKKREQTFRNYNRLLAPFSFPIQICTSSILLKRKPENYSLKHHVDFSLTTRKQKKKKSDPTQNYPEFVKREHRRLGFYQKRLM